MDVERQVLFINDWLHNIITHYTALSEEQKIGYQLALQDFVPMIVAYDIPLDKINEALGVPR